MLAHEVETQARPLSREDLSILALENETVAGHTCKVIVLGGPAGRWPQVEFNIEGNPFHNLMGFVREVRPHQATFVPDTAGQFTSDHGWDLRVDAERLREFAVMGAAYHRAVHGSTRPSVGLLNVGTETEKGHDDVRGADRLLDRHCRACFPCCLERGRSKCLAQFAHDLFMSMLERRLQWSRRLFPKDRQGAEDLRRQQLLPMQRRDIRQVLIRPRRRLVRVLAELPAGPPLPQQVPALVQRLLGGAQSLTLFLAGQLAGRELTTELMFGVDQLVDVSHDLLVVHAPTVSPWPAHCGPGSVI